MRLMTRLPARALVPIMVAALWLLPVVAAAQPGPAEGERMRAALEAARKGDWAGADAQARRTGHAEAPDIIEWQRLRDGVADWRAYADFVARRPDWPGLGLLRRRGEAAIPAAADPAQVVAFFGGNQPATGAGVVRLAAAYAALGRQGDAEAEAVRAWRTLAMAEGDEARLLERWGKVLAPHHEARLDAMLWQGEAAAAGRAEARVSEGLRRLAAARIALRAQAAGVDARISAVPAALAGDPGLAYERFLWRVRKGRNADAEALMRERSVSAAALGRPEAWAGERRRLARAAMREGDAARAYEIAARHFLASGSDYADLEWLAGYLALGPLGRPDLAAQHFTRFRAAVETPISLGRAGYWLGRAEEARGDLVAAKAAYAFGARYQTSFYGQLAAERGGLPPDPALAGKAPPPGDWRRAAFARAPLATAGLLLHHAGEARLARIFFEALAEGLSPADLALLGEMLTETGAWHSAVMLGKRAAQAGAEIVRPYYPLMPLAKLDLAAPPDLVLSIARRESEFDHTVVSGAGALGLMQTMPRTARAMAEATGQPFSERRLRTDWQYNARLGAAYLARLKETYGSALVLISAAYNAGPSRADAWIAARGDPRRMASPEAVVDWIEHIPFDETRNYVMRVLESVVVYRARLGGGAGPARLSALLVPG